MPTEYVDNERVKIQLAQHFRESWWLYKEMPKVQASRFLAALAVDFIQSRHGGKLPG